MVMILEEMQWLMLCVVIDCFIEHDNHEQTNLTALYCVEFQFYNGHKLISLTPNYMMVMSKLIMEGVILLTMLNMLFDSNGFHLCCYTILYW